MEFRLTYAGELLARNKKPIRSVRLHAIRWKFHEQLETLWKVHPVLARGYSEAPVVVTTKMKEIKPRFDINWCPIVRKDNGLICELDILMLRKGPPGKAHSDIDNRLKTIFDALRMPQSEQEMPAEKEGETPSTGLEGRPFYVLLEDDSLITHVTVTSDILLEPVDGILTDTSIRLVINVTVRPYDVRVGNVQFA